LLAQALRFDFVLEVSENLSHLPFDGATVIASFSAISRLAHRMTEMIPAHHDAPESPHLPHPINWDE
jgi:hypothetical protein